MMRLQRPRTGAHVVTDLKAASEQRSRATVLGTPEGRPDILDPEGILSAF